MKNFNTEVWDLKLFEIICPGRSKYVGRQRWLDRLLQAKEVFGEGHVGSNMVMGVELAEPYGFKTEEEGAASYLEGFEWFLSHRLGANGALFAVFLAQCSLDSLRLARSTSSVWS